MPVYFRDALYLCMETECWYGLDWCGSQSILSIPLEGSFYILILDLGTVIQHFTGG